MHFFYEPVLTGTENPCFIILKIELEPQPKKSSRVQFLKRKKPSAAIEYGRQ